MEISCDCRAFRAELTHFPANSPGRLVCYCRDCQHYLDRLDRADLLDPNGGTEVIPVYPGEVRILAGKDQLICNRVTPKGPFRWSTRCCNSPIANTQAKLPWCGIFRSAYLASDPDCLEGLGPVRARIYGRDAKGEPPAPVSDKIGFREMLAVLPFVMKGKVGRKYRNSPFFQADEVTPIIAPRML